MPFALLRKAVATAQDFQEDVDDLPPIPPELDEQRPPRFGDADHIYSVFYDAERFDVFPENLLQRVRDQFPDVRHWQTEPVHPATLHGRMAKYSSLQTDQFLRDGYIAELEAPTFKSGKAPKRSLRSQQAWDAFMVNASFAEAIVDAIRRCDLQYKLNAISRSPQTAALAPIVGSFEKARRQRGRHVLCQHEGLLVAPRALLSEPRDGRAPVIAYPAEPATVGTVSKTGRELYRHWTSDSRIAIRRRVLKEIRSFIHHPNFSVEAILMWALQTVAVLRVQATDWKSRERRSYVMAEAPLVPDADPALARAEDDRIEFAAILQKLRPHVGNFVPVEIKRVPVSARADVISMLAGGIGLEDENIWRDDDVLRDNFARQALGSLASWVGRLKRFHRETLTVSMARLIEEILTDSPNVLHELDRTGDDWSGPRLIRAQFPDAIWQALIDAAFNDKRGEVDIRYVWNEDPTQATAIVPPEADQVDRSIVIAGPLLDLNEPRRVWWRQKVEQFYGTGSLTI